MRYRKRTCIVTAVFFVLSLVYVLGRIETIKVARTREAIGKIRRLGGEAYRSDECSENGIAMQSSSGNFLFRLERTLGAEWLFDVVNVDLKVYKQANGVTNGDLIILREFPDLLQLDLRNTRIDDEGLKHLACLKKLKGLDLGGTQVTDAGLVHLVTMKELRELYLDNTQVSREGLRFLIQENPNLENTLGYKEYLDRLEMLEELGILNATENAGDVSVPHREPEAVPNEAELEEGASQAFGME